MFPLRLLRRLAYVALLLPAAPAAAERVRMHFDSDSAGRAPGFFDFVVWEAPGNAEWLVIGDTNPPSTPNKVIQTLDTRPAGSIAVALRRKYSFQDGTVSVALKRGGGRGGLVLRAAGEKDFLLLLIDLEGGDSRLVSRRDGKDTELARGKAIVDRDWGTLSVDLSGPSLTVQWGGKVLLKATDPHPIPGRIGLATAGPGQASFDELVFEPAASSR